jgi:hypothetical protein
LGGGQTCLAGLAVAAYANPVAVILTDGNEESVDNLAAIVELNPGLPLSSRSYRSRFLLLHAEETAVI